MQKRGKIHHTQSKEPPFLSEHVQERNWESGDVGDAQRSAKYVTICYVSRSVQAVCAWCSFSGYFGFISIHIWVVIFQL